MGQGIPTSMTYASKTENISKQLKMNLEEYLIAENFLLEHRLLICQEVDNKEIWFHENKNRWFLKGL